MNHCNWPLKSVLCQNISAVSTSNTGTLKFTMPTVSALNNLLLMEGWVHWVEGWKLTHKSNLKNMWRNTTHYCIYYSLPSPQYDTGMECMKLIYNNSVNF
jgi:hypothetical protein